MIFMLILGEMSLFPYISFNSTHTQPLIAALHAHTYTLT